MSCFAICTPSLGLVRLEWVTARANLLLPPMANHVFMNAIDLKQEGPAAMWTALVERALAFDHRLLGKMEWVFCIEDDVLVPADALVQLWSGVQQLDTSATPPVMCGWYRAKSAPHAPVIITRPDGGTPQPRRTGLEPVFCAGLGCALIHRRVFERLPRPWFDDTVIEIDDAPLARSGDVFFAQRCVQAGIPILLDWSVGCLHLSPDGTSTNPYATSGVLFPLDPA